jgi:hypothetical protein
LAQELATVIGRRHVTGECKNVFSAPFLTGDGDALVPFLGLRPIVLEARGANPAGVQGLKVRQIAIHRTPLGGSINADGSAHCLSEAQRFGSDFRLPGSVAFTADAEKLANAFYRLKRLYPRTNHGCVSAAAVRILSSGRSLFRKA